MCYNVDRNTDPFLRDPFDPVILFTLSLSESLCFCAVLRRFLVPFFQTFILGHFLIHGSNNSV